jgi:ATP-binding cassette subfamily F protein uup
MPGERLALVGHNGMGKSSLIHILAGLEKADNGVIEVNSTVRIGILQQTPMLNAELSVIDTMRESFAPLLRAINEHQKLCEELSCAPHSEHLRLEKAIATLSDHIERLGGFDYDFRMERVLSILGVKARTQLIKTLSGGEKRRVDLARVLLSAPDIYILDEPTNHLDINAIRYLSETLTKLKTPLIFVSHDSAFIDDVATKIIELDNAKIYSHDMPFANYIENKLVRDLIDARTLHRRERLVVNELAWLRAGTPARTTKQNARIDRAHELINSVIKDSEKQRTQKITISTANTERLGSTILEFDTIGHAFKDRVLFNNFNLKVGKGQRIGIVGPNGAGKTTLLSIIAGRLNPHQGRIIKGKNTKIIQFDQQREQLEPTKTLKETLAEHGDYVFVGDERIHIASYLEKYLFSPQDAHRQVATLSGGEQNRLLLAKLFRHSANCLLLDEPTNDLDISSLAVLEEHISDYEGVVFIVSHDRRFLDKVCTSILAFEPSTDEGAESHIILYHGNFSRYLDLRAQNQVQEKEAQPEKIIKIRAKNKRTFKEQREFEAIESLLEALEKEKTLLHEELAKAELFRQFPEQVQEKIERLRILDLKIENTYERWQELIDIGE